MIKEPEFSISDPDWQRAFRELEMDLRVRMALMLETVGIEAVTYLRSLTGDMQPGVRRGDPPRRAHPGGWADVTGQLAGSYYYEVRVGGRRISWSEPEEEGASGPPRAQGGIPKRLPPGPLELVLGNSAEYAAALEAKDGYYVLSGVTEESGTLRRTIRDVAASVGFDLGAG